MNQKLDLTLATMREALRLVHGSWPSQGASVTDNSFSCNSSATLINFEAHKRIRDLGFDDVEIYPGNSGNFSFKFIWKKEPKK